MFKSTSILLISLSMIFFPSYTLATQKHESFQDLIKTQKIWQNQIDTNFAEIKSEQDTQKLDLNNVWWLLSEEAKVSFLDSLVFNEKGLVGFKYSAIESELSVSEIYSLLSMFGAQRLASLMTDARIDNELDVMILNKPKSKANTSTDKYSIGEHQMMWDGGVIVIGEDDHKGYSCSARADLQRGAGSYLHVKLLNSH